MQGSRVETRSDNCFDFLRLFAAVCVVVSHSTEHLNLPFLWHTPRGPYWFYEGVEMFFILSGFLVYRSYEKSVETGRPLWNFFANRFLRVAPAIYVYAILTAGLLVAVGAISSDATMTSGFLAWFGSNFFLFPVYHPTVFESFGIGVLNGSLWTIPVEVSFYAAIPVLHFIGRKFGSRTLFVAIGVTSAVSLVIDWLFRSTLAEPLLFKFFKVSLFPYLWLFGLGVFWSKNWVRVPKRVSLLVACLTVYVAIKLDVFGVKSLLGPFWPLAWGIPFSYVVMWIGHHGVEMFNKITRIGDLSYGVYIWHMIVVNTFLYFGVPTTFSEVPGTALVAVVITITLLISFLSWRLVERPALRLKPFTSRTP